MYSMNGREAYLHNIAHRRRITRGLNTPVNTNHPGDFDDTSEEHMDNTSEEQVEQPQNKIEFNAKKGKHYGK